MIPTIVIAALILLGLSAFALSSAKANQSDSNPFEEFGFLSEGPHDTAKYEIIKIADGRENFEGNPSFIEDTELWEDPETGTLKLGIRYKFSDPTHRKLITIADRGRTIQSEQLDWKTLDYGVSTWRLLRRETEAKSPNSKTLVHFERIKKHSKSFFSLDFNNHGFKGWSGLAYYKMTYRGETFEFKTYARQSSGNETVSDNLYFYYPEDPDADWLLIQAYRPRDDFEWETLGFYLLRQKN